MRDFLSYDHTLMDFTQMDYSKLSEIEKFL